MFAHVCCMIVRLICLRLLLKKLLSAVKKHIMGPMIKKINLILIFVMTSELNIQTINHYFILEKTSLCNVPIINSSLM